jgi:predicted Zn-dependent peptidase
MRWAETVSLGAWVGAGTRHEAEAENGVAHFLEHMAFKGTTTRTASAIVDAIEAVGGHLNASTSHEHTAFYAKVLKQDAELALDVIADLLTHSTLDADELERERGVILQEIGQTNDAPEDVVFHYGQTAAFRDQPIGRPMLGTPASVRAMPRAALTAWLSRFYGTANTIVAAAGNISHERLLALAAKHFAALPPVRAATLVPAAYQGGVHREDRELDQAHIVLAFPGVKHRSAIYWPTHLLAILLGSGMSSRLFQQVRERRGLAYSISSFMHCYDDTGLFGLYAGTGETQVAELLRVVTGELGDVQRQITAEELRRAKAQAKANVLMEMESTDARCENLALQLRAHGRVVPASETMAQIEAVTFEDVQRAAAQLFRARPTLAAIGPLSGLPSLPAIAERLAA